MDNLYMAGTTAMLLAVAVIALLWPAGRFGTIWSGLLAAPSALWALLWGTAGIAAVVLWRIGVPVMTSTLAAAAAVALLVAPLRRDLWPIALRGALFFPILYGVGACAFVQIAPAFQSYWNHEALSGVALFGLPAEEIAWAVVWGATCPFLVAFASTLPQPERAAHTHRFRKSLLFEPPPLVSRKPKRLSYIGLPQRFDPRVPDGPP